MTAYEVLKESFKTGLVMLLPFLISVIIIKFLAGYVFLFINPIVRSTNLTYYTANIKIVAQGIAVLTVIAAITGMGYISNYKASERLSRRIEWLIKEIPVFGSVYTTIDRISHSVSGENSKFEKIVLVEFPKQGIYSLGLITSEAPDSVQDAAGGDLKSVFIPLSPNPTMGNLIMISEERYKELDMSIQEGIKVILTTGIAYEENEIPEEFEDV